MTRRARLHPRGTLGAGHFVKMIHNGIEYGLMQAYGRALYSRNRFYNLPADERFSLNLPDIAGSSGAAA